MKKLNLSLIFTALLSIPYVLVFSFYFWQESFQFQDNHFYLLIKMLVAGFIFFSPYLFFIFKNSKKPVLHFKEYSNAGRLLLLLVTLILSLLMSFYLGVIGKLIAIEGVISFFKYSFLPPLFVIYTIPYFVYTYSKNKDDFYHSLNNFTGRFN